MAVLDTGMVPNWRDYFPDARVATNLGTGFHQPVSFKAKKDVCGLGVEVGTLRTDTWVGSVGLDARHARRQHDPRLLLSLELRCGRRVSIAADCRARHRAQCDGLSRSRCWLTIRSRRCPNVARPSCHQGSLRHQRDDRSGHPLRHQSEAGRIQPDGDQHEPRRICCSTRWKSLRSTMRSTTA